MKVSKVGSPKDTGAIKRKKVAATDGAFAESLKSADPVSDSAGTVESGTVGAVDSILAVQEVPDATVGRSRGLYRQYGEDLLERLDDLRLGILAGTYPKDKLVDLAHQLRQRRQASDDPKLNEIIEEIQLRAEVEVAKLTRDR